MQFTLDIPLMTCVGIMIIACFCTFLPLIMKYEIQLAPGDHLDDLPAIKSLTSDSVKFTYASSVAISMPVVINLVIDSMVRKYRPSKEFYILVMILFLLNIPHIFATALMWISPEYYIGTQALIYCKHIVGLTTGGILLNTYGPDIWQWKYIIPILVLWYISMLVMLMAPFFCTCSLTNFTTASSILAVFAVSMLIFLFIRWCWHFYTLVQHGTLSQRDTICSMNAVIWFFLVLGSFINTRAQGQPVWTNWSPTHHITFATLYSTYMVFIAVFNRELIVMEIEYNIVSIFRCLAPIFYLVLFPFSNQTESESLMKKMIVGYFSHELRNPLGSALMGLEVLHRKCSSRQDVDRTFIELLNDVESSCLMATDVLDDLLMYERLEAGDVALTLSTLQIIPMLRRKFKKFQNLAKKRGILFNFHFSERCIGAVQVLADESKLKQIMRDVLYYTLEAAGDNGTVYVVVDVVQYSRANGHGVSSPRALSITVSNSGAPLSQEVRERMFIEDKIEFTAGVIERGKAGGLGLLIAHRLTTLNKGYMGFSSDERNEIVIILPLESSPSGGIDNTLSIQIDQTNTTFQNVDNPGLTKQGSVSEFSFSVVERIPEGESPLPSPQVLNVDKSVMSIQPLRNQRLRSLDLHTDQSGSGIGAPRLSRIQRASLDLPIDQSGSGIGAPRLSRIQRNFGATEAVVPFNVDDSHRSDCGSDISSDVGSPYYRRRRRHRSLDFFRRKPHKSSIFVSSPVRQGFVQVTDESDNDRDASSVEPYENKSFGRVLIVDDVSMNRKMLLKLLEGQCTHITEAVNGLEAVDRMRAVLNEGPHFDLVLMDYQMPVMDGPSAAKAMRDMGYDGLIIGVTGNVQAKDVQTFVSKGADSVLFKPLQFSTLQKAVLYL